MPKKKFDTTRPHRHTCPNCHKRVYCASRNCEIPEASECHECRKGYVLTTIDGETGYWEKKPCRFEGDTGRQQ